ncbi:MAG TPA: hypothetical protein VGK18_01590 [Propionicimonas sp.]|jgi:hypothetical protein|uniref:hypothetical protein n=1 Tax=Propionicimonas sp. TaxID=1955623 RepID=UPI002F41C7C3
MAIHQPDAARWTRRALVGSLFAVGAAGLLGCTVANGPSDRASVDEGEDPLAGDPSDESTPGFEIAVGDYSATVADGWKSVDDGKGGVVVTNGANRLTVVTVTIAKDALAVNEVAALARGHAEGFTGAFAAPVDRSTADVKRASVAGTGTFKGAPARLLCELWIDSTGFALLTTRIITASPDSVISEQAQEMVDELSLDF